MIRLSLAASLAACCLALPAAAHETLMAPHAMRAPAGAELGFDILSTHVMFAPEEMENIDIVSAHIVADGATTDAALRAAETEDRLVGAVTVPTDGPAWLVAHRHGVVWSRTPDGWFPGGRDVNPTAISVDKFERFSKALVNAAPGAAADSWGAPLGHVLEIVPLDNPADLDPGEEIRVQVLHDGAPIAATVEATFKGFSDAGETYAYVTKTFDDAERGPVARIKPWSEGLWAARVEHLGEGGDSFEAHVLRATLVFAVE